METLAAPLYLGQRKPQGQPAPENATSLVGSQDFSIAVAGVTTAGAATVSWNLTRGGAAPPPSGGPPTGTRSGTVLVNGKPYTSGAIAFGSKVDVTHGRLVLNTSVGDLTVYGGGVSAVFRLLRATERGKAALELRLVGGDFSACKRPLKRPLRTTSATSGPTKTMRRLSATGTGHFRTRGRYSAAAVRGAFWLTADRCDGTLTHVKQGTVEVTDLVKKKKTRVAEGSSYLAAPRH